MKSQERTFTAICAATVLTGFFLKLTPFMLLGPTSPASTFLECMILMGVPTLLIWVPIFIILVGMGCRRWWTYVIAGSLCGMLYAVVVVRFGEFVASLGMSCEVDPHDPRCHTKMDETAILMLMQEFALTGTNIAGAITAYVCWLIRRPDLEPGRYASTKSADDG
jgi:hypothetical protein